MGRRPGSKNKPKDAIGCLNKSNDNLVNDNSIKNNVNSTELEPEIIINSSFLIPREDEEMDLTILQKKISVMFGIIQWSQ